MSQALCIRKWPEDFGFTISGAGPVVITNVSQNSPAQKAGLQPGDAIAEMDGMDVSSFNESELRSLAIIASKCPPSLHVVSKVRVFSLQRNTLRNFGFTICGNKPYYIESVNSNSQARMLGMRSGDLLLSINEQNISQMNRSKVAGLINESTAPNLQFSIIGGAMELQISQLRKKHSYYNEKSLVFYKHLNYYLSSSPEKKIEILKVLRRYAFGKDLKLLVDELFKLLSTSIEWKLLTSLRQYLPSDHLNEYKRLCDVHLACKFEPSLSASSSNTSLMLASPSYTNEIKRIRLQKNKDGFGFVLTGSSPLTIKCINPGSSAERAGLKPGDRILELNGTDLRNMTGKKALLLLQTCNGMPQLGIFTSSASITQEISKDNSLIENKYQFSSSCKNTNGSQKIRVNRNLLRDSLLPLVRQSEIETIFNLVDSYEFEQDPKNLINGVMGLLSSDSRKSHNPKFQNIEVVQRHELPLPNDDKTVQVLHEISRSLPYSQQELFDSNAASMFPSNDALLNAHSSLRPIGLLLDQMVMDIPASSLHKFPLLRRGSTDSINRLNTCISQENKHNNIYSSTSTISTKTLNNSTINNTPIYVSTNNSSFNRMSSNALDESNYNLPMRVSLNKSKANEKELQFETNRVWPRGYIPPPPPNLPELSQNMDIVNYISHCNDSFNFDNCMMKNKITDTHKHSYKIRRRINWEKLDDELLQGTVWKKISYLPSNSVFKFEKLEDKFTEEPKIVTISKRLEVIENVLSERKSHNLSVLLASIKIPLDKFLGAIIVCDINTITEAQLSTLQSTYPNPTEAKILKELATKGREFSISDDFAFKMLEVPHFQLRAKAMLYQLQFFDRIKEIKPEIETVSDAASQLRGSYAIITILQILLAVGNYLNTGNDRIAQAKGFKIDLLPKLKMTKSPNKNYTLLDFLAETMINDYPSLVPYPDDITAISKASKIRTGSIDSEIEELANKLHYIKYDFFPQLYETNRETESLKDKVKTFIYEAEHGLSSLYVVRDKLRFEYNKSVKYFGEDPNLMKSDEFFSIFYTFLNDLNNTFKRERAK